VSKGPAPTGGPPFFTFDAIRPGSHRRYEACSKPIRGTRFWPFSEFCFNFIIGAPPLGSPVVLLCTQPRSLLFHRSLLTNADTLALGVFGSFIVMRRSRGIFSELWTQWMASTRCLTLFCIPQRDQTPARILRHGQDLERLPQASPGPFFRAFFSLGNSMEVELVLQQTNVPDDPVFSMSLVLSFGRNIDYVRGNLSLDVGTLRLRVLSTKSWLYLTPGPPALSGGPWYLLFWGY